MTDKKDYPKAVTQENLQSLYEKADNIQEKSFQLRYAFGLLCLSMIVAFPVLIEFFNLGLWLGVNGYFPFLDFLVKLSFVIGGAIAVLFVIGFAIVCSFPIIAIWVLVAIRILEKLGYPTNEERVFSLSFIIARYLSANGRFEATKKVGLFLGSLTESQRNFLNSKRKIYSPEFNMLRCGASQIKRMLLFSTDNVSDYFRNFGLAFIRSDYPESYLNLNALIEEAEKFGELKGRTRRLLSGLERYPNSLPWISSIIILIIAIIVYLLSGQHLPIVT